MSQSRSSVLAAGLALFSMFFGAGDLIWPLILGGTVGDKNLYATLGLLVTGVTLPLLGLLSMMLFQGDYRSFFGRTGRIPSLVLIFIIQAILGPLGSIPRLFTLSHATIKPYLPFDLSLAPFCVLACLLIFALTIRRQKIIDLLGLVLTPILLLCLAAILFIGFMHPPVAIANGFTAGEAFKEGLSVGYNTLDLIASFLFAPFVLSHFCQSDNGFETAESRMAVFKKMLKASLMAAGLLSAMYVGLTHLSSFYTPILAEGHAREARLSLISQELLGTEGAFIACLAVTMACLTTAIPLVTICADYIREDLMGKKGGYVLPLVITLAISGIIANLGFMGIANMLSPVLQVLCPGLIVLCILNMIHKLYEIQTSKTPVFVTFAISTVGYLA
jgi:branched-chain amino acid:cation transporter, LIVCS family